MKSLTRRALFLSVYAVGALASTRWVRAQESLMPDCEASLSLNGWQIDAFVSDDGPGASIQRPFEKVTALVDGASSEASLLRLVRQPDGYYGVVDFKNAAINGEKVTIASKTAMTASVGGKDLEAVLIDGPWPTSFQIEQTELFPDAGDLSVRFFVNGEAVLAGEVAVGDILSVVDAAEGLVKKLRQDEAANVCLPTTGCFLTEATCGRMGLADDCFELSTLRKLRDGVLARSAEGRAEIGEYYALAPLVMQQLAPRWTTADWARLYGRLILPCALLARLGFHQTALNRYRRIVLELRAELDAQAA